jgi:hypothetical protein
MSTHSWESLFSPRIARGNSRALSHAPHTPDHDFGNRSVIVTHRSIAEVLRKYDVQPQCHLLAQQTQTCS